MNVDDEIKLYLRLLLDHSNDRHDEDCPSDALLHEICSIMRQRIFPGPAFPAVQINPPVLEPRAEQEGVRAGGATIKA